MKRALFLTTSFQMLELVRLMADYMNASPSYGAKLRSRKTSSWRHMFASTWRHIPTPSPLKTTQMASTLNIRTRFLHSLFLRRCFALFVSSTFFPPRIKVFSLRCVLLWRHKVDYCMWMEPANAGLKIHHPTIHTTISCQSLEPILAYPHDNGGSSSCLFVPCSRLKWNKHLVLIKAIHGWYIYSYQINKILL